jgi:hypothetical protein
MSWYPQVEDEWADLRRRIDALGEYTSPALIRMELLHVTVTAVAALRANHGLPALPHHELVAQVTAMVSP